jgi:multidrug resistance efflux pump
VQAVYPKLRDDLIRSRQETPEGTFFVIKDPARRRFFRFREPEHLIARQLDGSTSLEALQQRVEAELGSTVSPEVLQQFIEQLRRLGLLHTDQPVPLEHTPLHRRVSGSPLYVRLKALDPDRLFNRLVGKVWFFFTPTFVALSVAIFAAAVGITIGHWDEFVRDVGRLYRFDALLLAWITMLLVTTAHEFAHGLTCKHFGGEVHEIGFLLLYFQPAFYCNISDAWLFPEKSKRLWVTFAGAYLEMFVWSLATLTWWITDTDNWVSFLALIVMATSGIKSVFNMNPLIKLDGYYLLSDYLGIPNLRQRSMGYLKAALKRLWGSNGKAATATPRERRIYLIYGVLATTYSCWLLGWIALHFGNYLVEQYQGPGFLAFSGLLMVAFRNPLSSVANRLPAPLRRPPGLARLRRPAVRAGLLVAALAALFLVRLELKIPGEFVVRPVRNADVRAPVAGTIEQVYVEEGDRVRAGDVLLRLSQRDYRAELGKVDADIAEKRATLRMLRAGPRPEEVGVTRDGIQIARTRHDHARQRVEEAERIRVNRLSKAEATAGAAEERLQYTRSDRDRLNELFARGLISRKQLDDAEQEVALGERELEVAQAERLLVSADTLAEARQELAVTRTQIQEAGGKLKLLLAGARPEAIEAAEAEIARLETERRYLADQVQLTTIASPAAGVVTTPKLREKVGEYVKQGDLILKIFELDTITPEVAISEKEIAEVRPGQKVVLKARAYPGRSFGGTVKAIAPAAIEDTGLGRKVFRVTIAMNEGSDLLKPEMTGNAKILCGPRPGVQLLTRRIARYVRVEFWSWW